MKEEWLPDRAEKRPIVWGKRGRSDHTFKLTKRSKCAADSANESAVYSQAMRRVGKCRVPQKGVLSIRIVNRPISQPRRNFLFNTSGFTSRRKITKPDRETAESIRDGISKWRRHAAEIDLSKDIASQYPTEAGPASTKDENKTTNLEELTTLTR